MKKKENFCFPFSISRFFEDLVGRGWGFLSHLTQNTGITVFAQEGFQGC
jgi:hypothetical protein